MGNDQSISKKTETKTVMTHQGIVRQEFEIISDKPASPTDSHKANAERVWGRQTPITRILNPELHMANNRNLALVGTVLFAGCAVYLGSVFLEERLNAKSTVRETNTNGGGDSM
jgi:hypothetical protein